MDFVIAFPTGFLHRRFRILRGGLCAGLILVGGGFSGCKDRDEIQVYRVSKAEPEAPAQKAPGPGSGGMGSMPPTGAPMDAGGPAVQPSQITGTPPSNWVAQPLSSMRQASFLLKGENEASADISLVALGGPAGGALDNVNRWLSQLGRPAITGEQFAQMAEHVTAPLGDVAVVDLEGLPQGADAGKDGRIIGGIVSGDAGTYFFKMRGNAALVESQKPAFIEWIRSVQGGQRSAEGPGASK